MIHFMVDFENVKSAGLHGSEYLCSDDGVTIFYSNTCLKIEKEKMDDILKSGCGLHICKLQNMGKNALDFYIASRIGEVFGSGYQGEIAIISKDKGFQAVQDYWRYAKSPKNIVLNTNIEQCILFSGEKSERHDLIHRKKEHVDIEQEYRKYQEQLSASKKETKKNVIMIPSLIKKVRTLCTQQ